MKRVSELEGMNLDNRFHVCMFVSLCSPARVIDLAVNISDEKTELKGANLHVSSHAR